MIKLLAIINAVVTWRMAKYQKFVHLIGQARTGKGTFLRLLQDITGTDNHFSTDLGNIGKEQVIAEFIGKQLVTCGDESRQLTNNSPIKRMTGQDSLTAKRVYKEVFSDTYQGTLAIASNYPIFNGSDTGLSRRLIEVHFDNTVEEKEADHRLQDRLKQEIPQLVSVVLNLDDATVENYLKGLGVGHIKSDKYQMWLTRLEQNSVANWLDGDIVFNQDYESFVGNKDSDDSRLYPRYVEYCDINGYKPVSTTKFSRMLLEECQWLGYSVKKERTRDGAVIRGLTLRSNQCSELTVSEILEAKNKLETNPSQSSQPSEDKALTRHTNPSQSHHLTRHNIAEVRELAKADLKRDDLTRHCDELHNHIEPLPDIKSADCDDLPLKESNEMSCFTEKEINNSVINKTRKEENHQEDLSSRMGSKKGKYNKGDRVIWPRSSGTLVEATVNHYWEDSNTVSISDTKGKVHHHISSKEIYTDSPSKT